MDSSTRCAPSGGRRAPGAAAASALMPAVLGLLALLALGGCLDATTLGDAPADHVVIRGTPTWSNGVAELMDTKCAVCHRVPRPDSSPLTVPQDVDLRLESAAGTIRGAEALAAQIYLGVLRQPIVYAQSPPFSANVSVARMPPAFATPLYADEIAALETWAAGVVSAELAFASPALSGASPMTAADGALLYTRFCQGCHGVHGAGGRVRFPLQGYGDTAGPYFANRILSTDPAYPMSTWPGLVSLTSPCTPLTCNGTQLDAIAAYLDQF